MICEKCPAKINLSLDITGRRDDGYHFVDMIMLSVGLCDTVTLEEQNEIEVVCNSAAVPCGRGNICYKAAEKFFEKTGICGGVKIDIDKKIPVGAGLAGGSTDAAGVLRGLNRIFGNPLTHEALLKLGASVGADVPFCIAGGCARAEGIGEVLTMIECSIKNPIVIAKPEFEVLTADVYRSFDECGAKLRPDTEAVIYSARNGSAKALAECAYNVLEAVTAEEHGEISEYKSVMTDGGALFSMMSGSGPSVFGIFEDISAAEKTAEILRRRTSEVFVTYAV